MNYQNYFKSVISSFLICCIIFCLAVSFQLGTPTKQSRWVEELYRIKSNFANSINTPKLLILSGSNGLFGISSQIIQKEINIPTVNYATHAGLGIDYILYRAKHVVKPGDTIIMPLEYEHYQPKGKSSDLLVDYVLARDPKYLLLHPMMITEISLQRLGIGIINKVFASKKIDEPKNDNLPIEDYDSRSINLSGDETHNLEANMRPEHYKKIEKVKPIKIDGKLNSNLAGFKYISNFISWCKKNNVRVIVMWPSLIWFEEYNQPKYKYFFDEIKASYNKINIEILGNYRDFMYSKSMFYNSNYHLNDKGRSQRTRQVIDLLKLYL